jgi:CheY-like chemotaxis protein
MNSIVGEGDTVLRDTVNSNRLCEKAMRSAIILSGLLIQRVEQVRTALGLLDRLPVGSVMLGEPRQEHDEIVVLIVDCEPIARNVFVKILGRLGYQVLEAATINEAMRICRDERQHIDALIAEFMLTDGEGTELAAEIRKHCPDVPVLLTSGIPMDGWSDLQRLRFAELGIRTDFLPKPFQLSVLRSKLQHLFSVGKGN